METVEVVIRVPKKQLESLQRISNGTWGLMNLDSTEIAILNGVVLPKGHDALIERAQVTNYDNLYDVPAVIEADRAESEGEVHG